MADCILKMADITKKFSGIRALDCVNLMIERGEIHALCDECLERLVSIWLL